MAKRSRQIMSQMNDVEVLDRTYDSIGLRPSGKEVCTFRSHRLLFIARGQRRHIVGHPH